MARPNSTNPDETRMRVFAAAREVATRDGIGSVSARSVAKLAGVSPMTVGTTFGSMANLQLKLVGAAFRPLIYAFEAADRGARLETFEIATAPLRAESSLPALVTQIAAYAGLHHGDRRNFAMSIDRAWAVARDHLANIEIPNSPLHRADDPAFIADRIIALYFAAALQLTRNPAIKPDQLRAIISGN